MSTPNPLAVAPAEPFKGFPPVVCAGTRILVLGSFPGTASLRAAQYYAHPRNLFWPIVGTVLGEDLADLDYPRRLEVLLRAGIGLWDVIDRCVRAGSLDSAIRSAEANDLATLCRSLPGLRRVCFNGQTAGRTAPQVQALGLEAVILPSTSPANAAVAYADKIARWQAALTL